MVRIGVIKPWRKKNRGLKKMGKVTNIKKTGRGWRANRNDGAASVMEARKLTTLDNICCYLSNHRKEQRVTPRVKRTGSNYSETAKRSLRIAVKISFYILEYFSRIWKWKPDCSGWKEQIWCEEEHKRENMLSC